ncbi:N-(5'phosphoribosyl)anthranilate isomerase [Leptospira broomii serovar Hurstbridge str. 5399]|uniref:N-(5'-phosphoribosyl)anthranilate isomerase n=1 Tax=Leptospira broomii serovar Hurstbridge str. 5399 TaxID=1049789 RepID=T0G912_9LEPT|nr:phosphoribosylanthranilate isomerase [Leptospira broomii]EQA43314.1 N-(5'phosphoribosyl)anthranilate isomerase [Leptospira broomii serovar Hurstbridge str. 5399]
MSKIVKVKICGIKDPDILKLCVAEGADFVGLNFSPVSSRSISRFQAEHLLSYLKNSVPESARPKIVFLFYKNSISFVESILKTLPYDYLQFVNDDPLLPGRSSPLIGRKNRRILSYRVKNPINDDSLASLDSELLILDSYVSGSGGGTGEAFPWQYVRDVRRPYFLAGGLRADTVAKAIQELLPYGVDVASGVESSPGVKDPKLVREFIKNAKRASNRN